MNRLILRISGLIALLVQILIPMWWGSVIASFYYFWIEGVADGHLNIGREYEGNLLWGLFSVYCIIAIIIAARSSFQKSENFEQMRENKKFLFLAINLITIAVAIMLVIWNGGFLPKM